MAAPRRVRSTAPMSTATPLWAHGTSDAAGRSLPGHGQATTALPVRWTCV